MSKIDVTKTVEEYINRTDWRVDANSNQGYSLGGLILNASGKIAANYWLDSVYTKEIGDAHRNGDFHIHDLDMICGYCFTGDTKVKTLAHGNLSFLELVEKHDGNSFYVYSVDKRGSKTIGLAHSPRKTREDVEIIKITLKSGAEIRCTLDHPFLLSDMSYKKASDLKSDDSLLSTHNGLKERDGNYPCHHVASIENAGRADVYDLTVEEHHNFALDAGVFVHNCAGWSLRMLLNEGFNGIPYQLESGPPKHLSTALNQMVNFLGTLQNEWAGAQAFSSVDTYLAPFIKSEDLSYKQVKQEMQSFIHNLNVQSRWGTQTPFTNLTFDFTCPDDLKEKIPLIGGNPVDFCYGELQKEMDMINKVYIEVMTEGDEKGRVFTFPIPTYNITPDFPWDNPNVNEMFEMTAKYGLPYFQNFLNSDLDPKMIRSMCCRLQLDLRELLKRGNSLFGSAEQTGSVGVVTLNCARLGFLNKNSKEKLYESLDKLMDLAFESLELKRSFISELLKKGMFPYTKRYLGTFRNHFSTIGVNGINEMIRNFTNNEEDITTERGSLLAQDFLEHIREKLIKFQEISQTMFNLEATPAEGTTYRFAKEDKKRFPNIIQAGDTYYTNSSQAPVDYSDDAFKVLTIQEPLQQKYTGGTVVHLYMNERISSSEICKDFVKKILTKFRIPYLTITPIFSICPKHGYLSGEHEYCHLCDEETTKGLSHEKNIRSTIS